MAIEAIMYALGLLACKLNLKGDLESIKGCVNQLSKEFKPHLVSNVNDVEVIVLLDYFILVICIDRNRLLIKSEKDPLLYMLHYWLRYFSLTYSNDHCELAIDSASFY